MNNTQADILYLYVCSYSIFPLLSLHQPPNLTSCTQYSAKHRYTDKLCTSNSCHILLYIFLVYLIRFTIIQRNIKYMNVSYNSLPFLYQIVRSQNSVFNKCLLIHKIQQIHPFKVIPIFRNRRSGCDRDMCGLYKKIKKKIKKKDACH